MGQVWPRKVDLQTMAATPVTAAKGCIVEQHNNDTY
jgi:hypothetical protein